MKKTLVLPSLLAILFSWAGAAAAQDACPCVPTPLRWVVATVDSWPQAMAQVIAANGDQLVFALPTTTGSNQWLVVRRVVGGAYVDDGTDPHQLEEFDRAGSALARASSLNADRRPMMLTAPDGRFVVIALRENAVKPRAARH